MSIELDDIPGVIYKHDSYQATIAAAVLELNHSFTIMALPTSGGKTFIIGLLYQFSKHLSNRSVIAVVPNNELKIQMIDQLGRIGRGLNVMTREEHMLELPKCDLLIIDEIDEIVLQYPYLFQSQSNTNFNGIWNWKDQQVIGLTATVVSEV